MVCQVYQEVQASKEIPGSQDNLDLKEDQDQKDQWAKWVFQVHWEAKVLQGALDVLVSPAPPDPLGTEVRRATQVDKSLDSQAFPDQRVTAVLLVRQDPTE